MRFGLIDCADLQDLLGVGGTGGSGVQTVSPSSRVPPGSQAAALNKRLRQIDAAENAHAREIESPARLDDPRAAAVTALRFRVLARFTELEDQRTAINTQLADLAKTSTSPGDPGLLNTLPLLGDWLTKAPAGSSNSYATPSTSRPGRCAPSGKAARTMTGNASAPGLS